MTWVLILLVSTAGIERTELVDGFENETACVIAARFEARDHMADGVSIIKNAGCMTAERVAQILARVK